ncbi:hypothetical protein Ppa06_41340 [Planomonospora parontospora subsp. parontospora]|uniref:Serine active site containing 1-like protein n=3 Tax=Planomonospora parontospora TaxID=58119 RepID=A0AA37BIY0_9ACTN|nr:hypothetical protein GCM10010126_42180 [Planomonospora parontospora]GII10336.1 hypothetical protein Ppa06_41340 [Planomonospora parontospora subsp. parontospora]
MFSPLIDRIIFSMLNISDERNARRALLLGIAASAVLTGMVWLLGQRLHGIRLLPDQGASWYYWKLPEPTVWTRASAWLGYAAHQAALWGLIYYAQTRVRRYTSGLHPVNVAALAVNFGFVLLHTLQTHLFYDGLAQDVSIFSSQGSVVLLLVAVLLMENRRRGLFLGRPAPIGERVTDFVRRYHGYLFGWAAVYTFWYHPMEATSGHLIGFFYMFLLLLQGSLFLTRAHTGRWWTFTLEAMVAVHGTLVAVAASGPGGAWPMFLFGFLGVFVVTQMHGLGLSAAARWLLAACYAVAVLVVYGVRGFGTVDEIVRIPVIEYLLVGVLAALVWAGLRAAGLARRRKPAGASQDEG